MPSTTPLSPREDEWYKAPARYQTANPGTILRVRTAPGELRSTFNHSAAIYNILFSTIDSHYQPSWAVSTLFVPQTTSAHVLLSYQIPYNSSDVNASPSHLLHSASSTFWSELIQTVQNALLCGWYVSIPDHEGPLAAFGDGLVAGHTTLDSIRASLKAGFGMSSPDTRVALWGYSGGALASGWAAELQPHYAPELTATFAGAALGALPPDPMFLAKLSGTPFAGLIPQFLLGITAQYPAAREYLLSRLSPTHQEAFLATLYYDIAKAFAIFAGQDIFSTYFLSQRSDIFQHALIRNILVRRSCIGYHGVPEMPLFIYKSIGDDVTPIEDTDKLVERWSYVGVNVVYERNSVGDHLTEMVNGRARAIEFLEAVLKGTYEHHGCTVRDVKVGVDGGDE